MNRRWLLSAALACGALLGSTGLYAAPRVLRLSHQWPASEDDFRDQLARKFAKAVEERTHGEIKIEVYPNHTLFQTKEQFDAMIKGDLDLTVYPISYAGPEVAEFNVFGLPTIIESYEQGYHWKTAPIGKEIDRMAENKGFKFLTWTWQATNIASVPRAILAPDDVKGLHIRTGGRPGNTLFKAAGGLIASMPSPEVYDALDQGILDAFSTTSESMVTFKIYKLAKHLTTARKRVFSYGMLPLLVSKKTFDSLTPEQRKVFVDVGAELEAFARQEAEKQDKETADIFQKNGVAIHDLDDAAWKKWREFAEKTAWKDFAESIPDGKKLLDMALAVK